MIELWRRRRWGWNRRRRQVETRLHGLEEAAVDLPPLVSTRNTSFKLGLIDWMDKGSGSGSFGPMSRNEVVGAMTGQLGCNGLQLCGSTVGLKYTEVHELHLVGVDDVGPTSFAKWF